MSTQTISRPRPMGPGTAPSPDRSTHKEDPMSTTTMHRTHQSNARSDSDVSLRGARERKHTLHVGTFADGQRASPVTVIYSADVGSFGNAGRK